MQLWIVNIVYFFCGLTYVYLGTVSSCNIGWFGSKCQYKCHCRNNQCGIQGDCTNGSSCEKGWFGPSCQYYDVASPGRVTYLPPQDQDMILDGDDDTCHDNLQQIILTWSMNYPFSWLRITVNDTEPDSLLNLTVLLKPHKANDVTFVNHPYLDCVNKSTSFINDRTVDVHCDVRESVQEILIYGAGIKTLCSVYISGGRNVALKQTAWQSSTEKDVGGVASRAVDGKWLGQFKDNSCTHTDVNDRTPVWKVTLSHPATISRFEILNRNDCCQRRLMYFTLETLSVSNTSVHVYSDSSDAPQNSFTILSPEPKEPITALILSAHHEWNKYIVLTLCEVELYGDTACPVGKFGRDCEQTCNCAQVGEPCLVSTGKCFSGCAAGYHGEGCQAECPLHFWGINCLKRCNQHCTGSKCDRITGKCLEGCETGFNPPDCTQYCDSGFYGVNCSRSCPQNCLDGSCNHTTGACFRCVPGYQGHNCGSVCDPGRYGLNCSSSCPVFCEGQSCDSITGHCVGCTPGYVGANCQKECAEGFYGANCSRPCPGNCSGNKCHHMTGKCDICEIGYQGDKCEKECEDSRWGQNCSKICHKHCFDRRCDKTSGWCDSGCVHGYKAPQCLKACDAGHHGFNCLLRCPLTCEGQSCDAVNGHCSSCTPGYKGINCQQECDEGFFGINCTNECPVDCSDNKCHHVSGNCYMCKPGFQGHRCDTVCGGGFYGVNCSNICPESCSGIKCNPLTGECAVCKPGYHGESCERVCSNGQWGPNCSEPCPSECQDNCDVITGSCKADCSDDMIDLTNCTRAPEAKSGMIVDKMTNDLPKVTPIVGLFMAFSLIANVVLIYENRRLKQNKGNYTVEDASEGPVIPQEENCIFKGKTTLIGVSPTRNSDGITENCQDSSGNGNQLPASNGTNKQNFISNICL